MVKKNSGIIVRKGDPCCGALLWVVAAIINIKNFGDDKYVMLPMRSCCDLFDWFLKIGDVLAIDGYDSRENKSNVMFIDDGLIFYEKLISEMSKVWDFFSNAFFGMVRLFFLCEKTIMLLME